MLSLFAIFRDAQEVEKEQGQGRGQRGGVLGRRKGAPRPGDGGREAAQGALRGPGRVSYTKGERDQERGLYHARAPPAENGDFSTAPDPGAKGRQVLHRPHGAGGHPPERRVEDGRDRGVPELGHPLDKPVQPQVDWEQH